MKLIRFFSRRYKTLFGIVIVLFLTRQVWPGPFGLQGTQFRKKGNNKKAIYYFNKALESGETEWWIYNNLASCLLETGQMEDALRIAQEGYKKYPLKKELKTKVLIVLSKLFLTNIEEDILKAEQYAKEGLKIDPAHFNSLHYYGIALMKSGQKDKMIQATDVLMQAVTINSAHPTVFQNMINAFSSSIRKCMNHNQLEEVTAVALKLLDHYHSHKSLYEEKKKPLYDIYFIISAPFIERTGGKTEVEKKLWEKMMLAMNRLLEQEPDNYLLKHSLGEAHIDINKTKSGMLLLDQAYEDYRKIIGPDETALIIASPLKGRLKNILHRPEGYHQPGAHSGIRKHAMDFIMYDKNNNNITAGKKVYVPLAGRVTRVVNDDPDHSRVYIALENGLSYYMSHFQPGSITAQIGQHVGVGSVIGVMGDLPTMDAHLHIEFTNKYHVSEPFVLDRFQEENGEIRHNQLPEKVLNKSARFFYYPLKEQ